MMIPRLTSRARSLWRGVTRRRVLEAEMAEEFRLHMEMRAEDLVRAGLSREEAKRRARLEFGSPAQYRDEGSLSRGLRWFDGVRIFGLDVKLGLRALKRRPLYALGVAGTLGLGLAAAMITFAVAWKVWLAPLPLPDPDRVVRLYELEPASPETGTSEESRRRLLSPTLLGDFNAHSWRTIEMFSAVMRGEEGEPWIREGETRSISRLALFPNGFGMLGIVPELGRLPSEDEVLLTEPFWRTAFGADPNVMGSEMNLGWGVPRIVGVTRLPSGYPGDVDIVMVGDYGMTEDEVVEGTDARVFRWVEAIARLRPGHTLEEAKAEMNSFLAALAEVHPIHRGWSMEVVVLADDLLGPFRGVLALLLAAGGTFLLLAGVNVLGLVAARRVESRQDRSIRLALGASEGRLLRGALIDSLVLALVGSLAGVLAAYGLIDPIRSMVPGDVPRLADITVSPPLVAGGLALGVALGGLIGVLGYLISRGARPSVGRAPAWRAVGVGGRRALVIGQVALTTVLTAGGAAVLHRVSTLGAIDLGFEPEGVSTTSTVFSRDRYTSVEQSQNARRSILEGLAARGIPAAMGINTPVSGDDVVPPMGLIADASLEEIFSVFHAVSADYFSVMGIEVLAGRPFGPDDDASPQPVAIVSEEFVAQYFSAGIPVEDVIGRVLAPVPGTTSGMTVVGVVRTTRHQGPALPVMPDVYIPLSQYTNPPVTLVVRSEPDQVAEAVSAVVTQVDPDLRWSPLVSYTSHLREWFAPFRLQLIMIGVLGTLGLVLACLGLYSFMAYQVLTRRQEIGVRKALGASDGKLALEVIIRGVALASLGAIIGLAAWYRLLPLSRELVDGIEAAGYIVPLSVAVVVGGSCVLATLIPAVRSTQVDPAVTLKA
ncbi:MAG: FtsX-like permease family protein, partial [Gemmatimonas sp.]|nr:FtsX-like permease family protein [Gemmatimonas sp.]